jgi:uncharacterized membrane protein YtjA (UPF0391 family)
MAVASSLPYNGTESWLVQKRRPRK